jgi:hypothetical protein
MLLFGAKKKKKHRDYMIWMKKLPEIVKTRTGRSRRHRPIWLSEQPMPKTAIGIAPSASHDVGTGEFVINVE